MKRILQTRFKLTLIVMGLISLASVAKTLFPGYPLIETYSALGTAYGVFMGAKTTNNIKDVKYNNVEHRGE